MKRLAVTTDGFSVNIEECSMNGLEVNSVLTMLQQALVGGKFPFTKEVEDGKGNGSVDRTDN